MSNYDEIKMLVEASRRALSGKMNESYNNEIRKKYGLLTEQPVEKEIKITDNKETELTKQNKDSDEIGTPKDKQKAYRVNGNIIVLHGKTKSDIQLTTDEKNAFTSSVDEFRNEVAEIVDFGKLNVFPDNVEWSGTILELDLEFFYTVNEPNGIYINGQMIKIDQDYLETVGKLQSYYEKFKTKWSKVVASRQEDIEK
jgi:hypothetical protein